MNLVTRAKNIVLTPKSEWDVIAAENTTTVDLYKRYIAPLAAIGPVASFIGMTMVGVTIPFAGTYRVPFLSGLVSAIITYALVLAGVFILSLIIDALAPTFGGQKNPMQALKVAAYAYTPAWLASVLQLIPVLGILVGLISLYGLYLLYLGLPVLMKSPKEKAIAYTAVVVICAIVLGVVFGFVIAAAGGVPGPGIGQMPMR
jgi:Yip1 domain